MKGILDELTLAQKTIYDCYTRLTELGVVKIANSDSTDCIGLSPRVVAKSIEEQPFTKGMTIKQVAEHYGYTVTADKRACWRIDEETLNQLTKLPEVLDPKKKFRVTFDYDPEFPRALLQVKEDKQ